MPEGVPGNSEVITADGVVNTANIAKLHTIGVAIVPGDGTGKVT